jgi:hypothetical protein
MNVAPYIPENTLISLRVLNTPYKNELTHESARSTSTHPLLKVPLRAHQAATVHSMIEQEKKLTKGLDLSGQTLYGAWSILGDGVGVGKSLSVLAHIAALKAETFVPSIRQIVLPCTPYLYSMSNEVSYTDLSECNSSLIIVPHTLYRQWCTYIKEQTTLETFSIAVAKTLDSPNFMKKLFASDIILISNTLYASFSLKIEHIRFKRVYIDEADTIRITGSYPLPTAKFIWLVTASWPNLLFPSQTLWISTNITNYSAYGFHPDFINQFKNYSLHAAGPSHNYFINHYHVVSARFFSRLLLPTHRLRGNLVLRSSQDFIKMSISLPPLYRHTVLCRSTLSYQMVAGVISAEVRGFLHAGDIQSALVALGVKEEGATNLVAAVTKNREHELTELRREYKFKEERTYSTPAAKDAALLNLRQKIKHLEDQISSIKERIENFKSEVCPI